MGTAKSDLQSVSLARLAEGRAVTGCIRKTIGATGNPEVPLGFLNVVVGGQASECGSEVSIPSGVSLTSLALSNWFAALSLAKFLHISKP